MGNNIIPESNRVLVLDFGSQYTQMIAKKVRQAEVYCEIQTYNHPIESIKKFAPQGIILSGGPASALEENAPSVSPELFKLGVPILAVCYGMQLVAKMLGGEVLSIQSREHGATDIELDGLDPLFTGISAPMSVWMSHGDRVKTLPPGCRLIAHSEHTAVAAYVEKEKNIYCLQFHPEVTQTPHGIQLIRNFLFEICHMSPTWCMKHYAEEAIARIRKQVGSEKVICALSGGLDSSVVTALIHKAIGNKLTCVFVNNGLLRKNEPEKVKKVFWDEMRIPLVVVNAEKRFLKKLKGVSDPEAKRKIINNEFVAVFDEEARKLADVQFLAQGTLYPDVLGSISFRGPTAAIRSHYSVGGLPEKMGLQLVEPLKELFKDEVRELGRVLGLSEEIIGRQPFPGPGLAVRIIDEVNQEKLDMLREADEVMMQEIKKAGWYHKVWQTFCILLPIKTRGHQGDVITYEHVVAFRAVESEDGMTAEWAKLPYDLLAKISNRIIKEVEGINRVVFDISSKPPATIEWE